jgi:hypothetical protein
MEMAADASGNRGNSVSAHPALMSSDGAVHYNQIRDFESDEAPAMLSRVKVEMDPSGDALTRPSESGSSYLANQRIQSENSVGSTSDLSHGHRSSRRSALYSQPHHAAPASGGISPMAMNNPWPTSSSFSHQLQSNPGQPSPPTSRRGSFSFASGPYAVLDSPFQSYMPQRTSFSFAADLSAPVAVPGVSAALLPSALGFDFPEEDGSLQSVFHMNALPQQHMYYPSVPNDVPGISARRESRGGELFEFSDPDFPPKFSSQPQLPSMSSTEAHASVPLPIMRSQTSAAQTPRGRGRPAKRTRGGGATHNQNTSSTSHVSHPARSDMSAVPPQTPHPPLLPLLPAGIVPTAFAKAVEQPSSDLQSRKRRNSAVSLMLLGDPTLVKAPSGQFPEMLQNKDTPTSVSETPASPVPQRKKRKQLSSDDDDDDDFTAEGTQRSLKESFHAGDEDDEYVSESETSASKRAKTSSAPATPRKPTGSARTGSTHWPVLKMEPVILPRTQQQQLDALYSGDGDGDDDDKRRNWGTGRKKIRIEFIENKLKRQITFSKRKSGMMKKIHELTTLTGTEALLILVSETGHIYSYATPRTVSLVDDPDVNPIKNALESYVRTMSHP